MAHKKGVGSTDNGRDSKPKYLGVKLFGSQYAKAGNIIVRQRGTKYHPGENVYMGRDHTLHAKIEGYVDFTKKKKGRTYVSIIPLDGDSAGGAAVKSRKARKAEAKPKSQAAPAAAGGGDASKANKGNGADGGAGDTKGKTTIHRMTMEEYEAKKAAEAAAAAAAAGTATSAGGDKPAGDGGDAKSAAPKAKEVGAKPDKLTKIEGIGPKISEHLGAAGIITFADLAGTPVSKLKDILEKAGPRYKMHVPDSWPQQAQLATDGKWDELEKLQDALDGGRIVSGKGEEE